MKAEQEAQEILGADITVQDLVAIVENIHRETQRIRIGDVIKALEFERECHKEFGRYSHQ